MVRFHTECAVVIPLFISYVFILEYSSLYPNLWQALIATCRIASSGNSPLWQRRRPIDIAEESGDIQKRESGETN